MQGDSIEVLYARLALCRSCIKTVSEVPDSDPRKSSALEEYNRQFLSISNQIAAIEGKPPPVIVGLKPAVLNMKGDRLNER